MVWRKDEPAGPTEIPTGAQYIRDNWAHLESVLGVNLDLNSGTIANRTFVSGMRMWFYADVAPTGWNIVSASADTILAVKGGAQSYNVSGGNIAGTWQQPNHVLTINEIPSHNHYVINAGFGPCQRGSADVQALRLDLGNINTNNVGGGAAHNHGDTYRPRASVGIICQKT